MEIIGQEGKLSQIKIALKSAKIRNRELPHMMLSGAPGCGKTTIARYVAEESGGDLIQTIPDSIKSHKDIITMFEKANHDNYDAKGNRVGPIKPSVIFIDEAHRLSLASQEMLGIAMENYTLETGRSNQLFWIPYFTLLCATTLSGNLSRPFINRFKIVMTFTPYNVDQSCDIVKSHCKRIDVKIDEDVIPEIARRCRGVPRMAISLIERTRDLSLALGLDRITLAIAQATFLNIGIDDAGFTETEIRILKVLYDNDDTPIGLDNLAIITNEAVRTLKDSVEPYLIQQGMMIRSGSGRTITRLGRTYLENQNYAGNKLGKQFISAEYVRT